LDLSSISFDYLYIFVIVFHQIANDIGDEGATAIGEALKKNTTLLELDLRGISFDYLYIFVIVFHQSQSHW
jgi:hypothetical protein